MVCKKLNNHFGPKEPPRTVRKQLQVLEQKAEEALEEYAERCQTLAYDAWGDISVEVAKTSAIDAFYRGALDSEAVLQVMVEEPATLDKALELTKKAIHNRKSVNPQTRTQKAARSVSFCTDSPDAEVRSARIPSDPAPTTSDTTVKWLEAEMQDLKSSVGETKGQLDRILSLLGNRSRSPSPSGPCFRCNCRGHIA